MKINHLKINGFGKLVNKDIELKNNINLIYGLNEAGKSTIQKFILGMLFGISRNRNGKELTEFDKYYPWNGIDYSGKISYSLDSGEEYEVFRDFLRKNPSIYDKNKNDISDKYELEKNRGNLFFEKQTGVDEKLFLDTAVTTQASVKLDKSSQANIIQKITNIFSSGDENISYLKTIEKIQKMQNNRIGSNRTTQKPINIINDNILKIEKEQLNLRNSKYELEENEKREKELNEKIILEKCKLDLVKDMSSYLENSKIQFAELDFNKRLEEEYDEKIKDLQNKIDVKAKQNIRLQKKSYLVNYIIEIISIVLAIATFFYFKNYFYIILFIIVACLNLFIAGISKFKNNKKIKEKLKQIDELQNKIDKEISFLNKSKEEKCFETKIKSERLNISIIKNEEKLSEKYKGKLEEVFIEKIFSMELEELNELENSIKKNISNYEIEINSLKYEKEALNDKISKLEDLDNNLNNLNDEKEKLDSLNISFKLALETIEEAYKELNDIVNPSLSKTISEMIEKISDGKYTNIIYDENNGLCVEIESGEYISCNRLSIGTIDEIYLSLRLSVLKMISNESLPIILDEAFAYFDDERLENILYYLYKNFSDTQIILFSSSRREKHILDEKLKIKYNYIEL